MKNIKSFIGTALLTASLISCNSILDEQPRSIYEPGFFKTETGVRGGLTAMYAHLRWLYGDGYLYSAWETGTDEATWAQSADGNFKDMDMTDVGRISVTTHPTSIVWGNVYSNINTANGVIENAMEVGLSPSLIGEAQFFRAFDYFLLVQTYGGVPLDLGSGELKFNTAPVRVSVRNTVPEVYTKAIFPDLLQAVANLPENPRVTGAVTKTVARLYLAKAYLTYGWWLENPGNIPTYPETARTDPDGKNAQWYFQQAYEVAMAGINNPGPYKLQPTFYDLHYAPNDRNMEMLLYADHTETSELYNGGSLTFGGGGPPDNWVAWMMTWNYTNIRSSTSSSAWNAVSSVQRAATQDLGRPWTRMAPPIEVLTKTFAEKKMDSRYDGTFTTVYRANWDLAGDKTPQYYNANYLPVKPGEPILSFLSEEPATAIDYSNSVFKSNVGAGVLPGRADFVISPNGISRLRHPGIWKLGTYRTDNAGGLGQPNAGLTRPFYIAKFSELYFIAAEAAVKGATTTANATAKDLINVIRARAGKWRFSNAGNTAKVEDNSAAMVAATPATIDINYILAERSREYYGEGYRWFDLVRTQKWAEIAAKYTIGGPNATDFTPQSFTRNIQPHHYLRPIPQGQIDGMEMTPEDKKAYQNPGYQ
jgi:hypothetical protein